MNKENTSLWPLGSGNWDASDHSAGFQLVSTALGHAVARQLSAADLAGFLQLRSAPGSNACFPPEFAYSPLDGSPLAPHPATDAADSWIPPFGSCSVNTARSSEALGLRKAQRTLALSPHGQYDAERDADATLPVPPPGEYQFISSQFGTSGPALLALDPAKGSLFVWLPASASWQAIEGAGGRLLAESHLPRPNWRCELLTGFHGELLLATDAGLARLIVDLPALQYQVSYSGAGAAVGAPVAFNQRIWLPLQDAGGSLRFGQFASDGRAGDMVEIANAPPRLSGGSGPVAYGRMAVWLYEQGQLHLQQQADGSVSAQFIAWPAHITPEYAFGSPYQGPSGALWQLCFDHQAGSYLYLELGKLQPQQEAALTPRFCSGYINYRFASKLKKSPWLEPEQGDDGAANEVVIPLLETGAGGVLGIKLRNTLALSTMLDSSERMRWQLLWDDDDAETVFHTGVVSQPWLLRLFTHDNKLWAYHPQLARIEGWNLAP